MDPLGPKVAGNPPFFRVSGNKEALSGLPCHVAGLAPAENLPILAFAMDDTESLLAQAMQAHWGGDPAGAALLYERVAAVRPDAATALHFWGLALSQLGHDGRALELVVRSLEMEPRNVAWLNNLGNLLAKQGDYAAAEEVFRRMVGWEPSQDIAWANLGAMQQRQGRLDEAEAAYRRAATLNPRNREALTLLGRLLGERGRDDESARFLAEAVALDPAAADPYELGKAYLVLGRVADAAEVYRAWKEREPDNPTPAHLHAACSRENVPEKCSAAYVEATFDAFAGHFDEKLRSLSYRGPDWIATLLGRHSGTPSGEGRVLDACCGTGLCGPVLRPFAAVLEGIDLSQAMLERARERNVYDRLDKAELQSWLLERPDRYDAVCCADSLIYFGNLRPLFAAVAASLRPGGLFLFTLETTSEPGDGGYRLAPSGRYLHDEAYVREALPRAGEAPEGPGLELAELFRGPLRTEGGRAVPGLAIAARRV